MVNVEDRIQTGVFPYWDILAVAGGEGEWGMEKSPGNSNIIRKAKPSMALSLCQAWF